MSVIQQITKLTGPLASKTEQMLYSDNIYVMLIGLLVMTLVLLALILIPIFVLFAIFGDGGPCPEGTRELTEFSHFIWTGKVQVPVYETVGCIAQ